MGFKLVSVRSWPIHLLVDDISHPHPPATTFSYPTVWPDVYRGLGTTPLSLAVVGYRLHTWHAAGEAAHLLRIALATVYMLLRLNCTSDVYTQSRGSYFTNISDLPELQMDTLLGDTFRL